MRTLMIAVLLLTFASVAEAAQCKPSQVNGRWAIYADDQFGAAITCLLTVRRASNLTGVCFLLEFGEVTQSSVRGTLRVNRACVLTGAFEGGNAIVGHLQPDRQGGAGLLGTVHFSLIRRP